MNRRRLLALAGATAAAWPCGSHAQERVRRVAILAPYTGPIAEPRITAFRARLAQLGWSEGRNLQIDHRWGLGEDLLSQYALELVALAPDVIITQTLGALRRVQSVNRSIPVVVATAADLVEVGAAESLAHPGGNVTGFGLPEFAIGGKWLELLRAVAPGVGRILYLYYRPAGGWSSSGRSPQEGYMAAIRESSPAVQVIRGPTPDAAGIADVIEAFAREPNGGLIVHPNPFTGEHRDLIVALAAKYGLPAMYPFRGFVEHGGLISYGIDLADRWRSVAGYVDLILRGTPPGDLPVQSPTRIELVINLTTAKALGLTVPPRLIAGADEVIR
jgi:putative ABC transport system substrate-binding protein